MGENDLERRAEVPSAIDQAAKAYFALDKIVEAFEGMPEGVRDRALDEAVSGMIDRIDGAPDDPLLSDEMKHAAMAYLIEAGLEFRASMTRRGKA